MKPKRISIILPAIAGTAAAVMLVAISASMLSNLRHALGRRRHAAPEPESDRRDRIRRALAPILVTLDPKIWGDWLQPLPDDFDRDAFRRSLKIDPPLSQAIIEEREEGL